MDGHFDDLVRGLCAEGSLEMADRRHLRLSAPFCAEALCWVVCNFALAKLLWTESCWHSVRAHTTATYSLRSMTSLERAMTTGRSLLQFGRGNVSKSSMTAFAKS